MKFSLILIGFLFIFFSSVDSKQNSDNRINTLKKQVKKRKTPRVPRQLTAGKQRQATRHQGICNTESCRKIAEELQKYINPEIDPCQDFNEYVCGNWKKIHQVTDKKPRADYIAILQDKSNNDILNILRQPLPPGISKASTKEDQKELKLFEMVKKTFHLCINKKNDNSDVQNLLASLHLEFTEKVDKMTLTTMHLELNKINTGGLFKVSVMKDQNKANQFAIHLEALGLGLGHPKLYEVPQTLQAYEKSIATLLETLLGETFRKENELSKTQNGFTLARGIIDLEKRLAQIKTLFTEKHAFEKPKIHQISIDELQGQITMIDWKTLLNGMLKWFKISHPLKYVSFFDASFIKNLDKVIQSTPPLIIKYFFQWNVIQTYVPFLEETTLIEYYKASKVAYNAGDSESNKSEACLGSINLLFPNLIGRWYTKLRFTPHTGQKVLTMTISIQNTMKKRLKSATWLDEASKMNAMKKLSNLDLQIGFPKKNLHLNRLMNDFMQLKVDGSKYFNTYRELMYIRRSQNWRKLINPEKDDWDNTIPGSSVTPQGVNAFNYRQWNALVLPVSILKAPLFDPTVTAYLNYGAMGTIIGHEMTHGFDNEGRHYDLKGQLKECWTPQSAKQFENRAQCYVKQYSAFSHQGTNVPVNGHLTLAENIADNGGLSISWETWKSNFDSLNNDALPGLTQYTPDQLFFISYAVAYCANATPAYNSLMSLSDPHAPSQVRINGVVQNSPEFSKAFNCPVNSPMNPSKKCVLW